MLHKLQKGFQKALTLNKAPKLILKSITNNNIDKEELVSIYKENVFRNLTLVLKEKYSSVCNLVGEQHFRVLCEEYIKENLPTEPSLIYYGKSFINFLRNISASLNLKHLPDIALFDWLWHECRHASEDIPLLPAVLKYSDNVEAINLQLRSSIRLFTTTLPANLVWSLSQETQKGEVVAEKLDVITEKINIMLLRVNFKVEMYFLNDVEYYFLNLFDKKLSLDLVLIALLEKFSITEAEITEILSKFLCLGVFKAG
jgi:hypothetical protein